MTAEQTSSLTVKKKSLNDRQLKRIIMGACVGVPGGGMGERERDSPRVGGPWGGRVEEGVGKKEKKGLGVVKGPREGESSESDAQRERGVVVAEEKLGK